METPSGVFLSVDTEQVDCGTVEAPQMAVEFQGDASHVYALQDHNCVARRADFETFIFDDVMTDPRCEHVIRVRFPCSQSQNRNQDLDPKIKI